jgi:hypothetical protein
MPQMDDTALLALQTIFEEVATLSYRLREWMALEFYLRQVETSFKPFSTTLQRVGAPADLGTQVSALTDLWIACRYPDLMDLSTFADGIQYLNQPAKAGSAAYSSPKVGIEALVNFGNSVEQAIANGVFNDLKDSSSKFQLTLAAQLANRRIRVRSEVDLLCALTDRLRERL